MNQSYLLVTSLFLFWLSQSTLAADGKALYEATCIACHGAKAEGAIPGVPDLAKGGRLAKPDAELVANILNGFQTKGSAMAMPAKGGNPGLTPADAQALVSYLRTLTGSSASAVRTVSTALRPTAAPAAAVAATPAPPLRSSAPPVAATADAAGPYARPEVDVPTPQDMAAFARGATAWANNCSRCHNMRDPKDLSDRRWKVVTTHMQLRAGLDGEQVRDITTFLQGSN